MSAAYHDIRLCSTAPPILQSLCHDGVCGYVGRCLGVYCVSNIKRKLTDRNDLKLGRVVGLDTVSNDIDFGFKRSGSQWHRVNISKVWQQLLPINRIKIKVITIFYQNYVDTINCNISHKMLS